MTARKKIYLDYAASTPMRPEVLRAMRPYFSEKFGNPGSLHSFGQEAMAAIDQSRETIARLLGVQFRDIIFTGSATEANNMALRGAIAAWRALPEHRGEIPRVIISSIEHESILETAGDLEKEGVEIVSLPVDAKGIISLPHLREALQLPSVVVSIMYGNNEIGSIQPIPQIAEMVRSARGDQSRYPLFHTDAVQAISQLPVSLKESGIDCATFSGHKLYGPKGVGVLYVKNLDSERSVFPIITGGGQEFGVRSGTENVPLLVGMARAMKFAFQERDQEVKRLRGLKEYFWNGLRELDSRVRLNGPSIMEGLPHILNVSFSRVLAADLLVALDLQGVAVSAGSACRARSPQPSHVLKSIGLSDDRIQKSLRFSFGRGTTRGDLGRTISLLQKIIK